MKDPCAICGAPSTHTSLAHMDDVRALKLQDWRQYPMCPKHDQYNPGQRRLFEREA